MLVRFARVGLVLLISCRAWSAPRQTPRLSDVISGVSGHVKEFQELLPDFVCQEKITSTTMNSGRTTKQTLVESIFTGVQTSAPGLPFKESREVTAIDGKPVRPGTRMPKLPFSLGGGFSSLLAMVFSPANTTFYNYEIPDTDKWRNQGLLFMRFATKPGQHKLGEILNGQSFTARDVGKALINTSSMQVSRLVFESLNTEAAFGRASTVEQYAEYGPVSIGERQFWMPQMVRADLVDRNANETAAYIAEYSNCRKFTTSVEIRATP